MKVKEIILGVVFCIVFFGAIAFGDTYQSYYKQYATVSRVEDDYTAFVDAIGDEWIVTDTDYTKGENVKITFYNNHTDRTREDDIIVKVKRVD